jgi:LysM repeat protein
MESKRNSPARFVAPIALALAAVLLVVVVTSSISGGGEESKHGGAKHEKSAEGSGDKYYTVEPGDSFSVIAEKVGTTEDHLQQLNPDLDPQALHPGQQVRLR